MSEETQVSKLETKKSNYQLINKAEQGGCVNRH